MFLLYIELFFVWKVFTGAGGDRYDIDNYVVILSDMVAEVVPSQTDAAANRLVADKDVTLIAVLTVPLGLKNDSI